MEVAGREGAPTTPSLVTGLNPHNLRQCPGKDSSSLHEEMVRVFDSVVVVRCSPPHQVTCSVHGLAPGDRQLKVR